MPERKLDYLIVGQGIAGSWLAYELLQRGLKIMVINEEKADISSIKAAGLYNPITGKKMVKTWMADQLFPSLEDRYSVLEDHLSAKFLHKIPIYRPFSGIEILNDWEVKGEEECKTFVNSFHRSSILQPPYLDPLGGVVLNHSGYVDLPKMLIAARAYLKQHQCYRKELFNYDKLQIRADSIEYGSLKARKIVFCEGPFIQNPLWRSLPYRLVRGEIIDLKVDHYAELIVNQGVFIIPKKDRVTVGSTYDHQTLDFVPQQKGIQELIEKFKKIFTGTFTLIEARAGVRPATFDRRPFIGLHPVHKTLGIFNGFGTKGVSLIPYFVKQFVDFLEDRIELDKAVDIERVF
jgi:glycine/D-amino acid oxidase-like deaminating enzyme